MSDITFIIPFAKHHDMLVERAVDSVRKQSLPCQHIVLRDNDGRGPGYWRNRGLEQARTDYVSFLDADDTVAPNFAEKCLEAVKSNHYVYTDWHDGQGRYGRAPTPCKVWTEKTFHLVTTLLHIEDARRIGGFDETLSGGEDTDFGVRLRLSGVCGVHLAQALVLYTPGGQRSNALRNSPADIQIQRYFDTRYGGYKFMGCCGADYETPVPLNEKQEGDILLVANWAGNKPYVGYATGRRYGNRVGNFRAFWIAKTDAEADPASWRKPTQQEVQRTVLMPQYQGAQPPPPPPARRDWQSQIEAVYGGGQPPAQAQPQEIEYRPNVTGMSKAAALKRAQG